MSSSRLQKRAMASPNQKTDSLLHIYDYITFILNYSKSKMFSYDPYKSSQNLQNIQITNEELVHKDARKRQKKKIYNYIQINMIQPPQQDLIPYYLTSFKCIIKFIHNLIMRKPINTIELLQKYKGKGLQLVKKLYQELHCEESVLRGKIKVKDNVDKFINKFWLYILSFYLNCALCFKENYKIFESVECFRFIDKLCDEIYLSCTSKASLLRKICRIKMQYGVLYIQIGQKQQALIFIEQSLNVARDQLSIRCQRKDFLKKNTNRYKEYKECKKQILMVFIILAYIYEDLKIYDIVSYLIKEAKKQLLQFHIEKSDGIYKTIEKLQSKEFLRKFQVYEISLIQISEIIAKIFDDDELNHFHRKHEKQQLQIVKENKENHLIKKSKQNGTQLQVSEVEEVAEKNNDTIDINQNKNIDAQISHEKNQQGKNENLNLTKYLLQESFIQKPKRKRYKVHKKSETLELAKDTKIYRAKSTEKKQETQLNSFLKIIFEKNHKAGNFTPFQKIQDKIRKFSLNVKKLQNETNFEKYKIKSRSRYSIKQKDNGQYRIKFHQQQAKPVEILTGQINKPQKKAETPLNIHFQQLIFRHKDELKLNYLQNHHNKVNQKQKQAQSNSIIPSLAPSKIKKISKKQFNFKSNQNLVKKLHTQSLQGITQLLNQIKKEQQLKQEQKENQIPLIVQNKKSTKHSELFLTYLHKKVNQL